MQSQIHFPEPKIQIVNNQAVTSSVDVAEFFEKRHDDVLKAIRNIIKKDNEWGLRNFAECEIIRDIPLQGQKAMPCYTMTRDGFTMLAMSFTGDKAFKFKITYISAFNAMESQLMGQQKLQNVIDAPSTTADRKDITNLLNTWVKHAPIDYRSARIMLNAHLGVESAEEIMLSQIPEAVAWLQEQINLHIVKPLPGPELTEY